MSKILVFADNHFCERVSIVNKFGLKYSVRLENQIATMNWIADLANSRAVNAVVCLGDFFDKPQLTDQELTALNEIKWAAAPHYFLVGNHESEENDLQYSSTKALESENRLVVDTPRVIQLDDCELAFLPYIVESNRKGVGEYFSALGEKRRILFSHNDLFGVQLGPIVSVTGFKPDELGAYCDLCLNGHLHNGQKITDKVMNLGNITGRDFGEDFKKYKHCAAIVDTESLSVELIENPHALAFYKIEIGKEKDLSQLKTLADHAVISVKVSESLASKAREIIDANDGGKIVEHRLVVMHEETNGESKVDPADLTMDQYARFAQCCREKLENTEILEQELAEILK